MKSTEGVTKFMDLANMASELAVLEPPQDSQAHFHSVLAAVASLLAAMVTMHVATPEDLMEQVARSWRSTRAPPFKLLKHAVNILTHQVLSSMAAGGVARHASMAKADVPAAMAAVRVLVPDLAAGVRLFARGPHLVGFLLSLTLLGLLTSCMQA